MNENQFAPLKRFVGKTINTPLQLCSLVRACNAAGIEVVYDKKLLKCYKIPNKYYVIDLVPELDYRTAQPEICNEVKSKIDDSGNVLYAIGENPDRWSKLEFLLNCLVTDIQWNKYEGQHMPRFVMTRIHVKLEELFNEEIINCMISGKIAHNILRTPTGFGKVYHLPSDTIWMLNTDDYGARPLKEMMHHNFKYCLNPEYQCC